MATAPIEHPKGIRTPLGSVRSDLLALGQDLAQRHLSLTRSEVLRTLVEVEDLSRIVDHLQVLAARAARDHDLAGAQEHGPTTALVSVGAVRSVSSATTEGSARALTGSDPATAAQGADDTRLPEYRTCADFLRARLGISRSEANRRLKLAASLLPAVVVSGAVTPAPMTTLGAAAGAGTISGRAVSIVHDAVQRARPVASPLQLESMEHHLTRQAVEADEDILRVLARRWEGVLDQDGQEPTEKVLRARQGVFLKGRRNGLHLMEIGATDEQFEHLVTVMNTATNPRTKVDDRGHDTDLAGSADGPGHAGGDGATADRPTRPQRLLDGLVAACRVALSTEGLPAAGGHRPQVMVTIGYQDLVGELERAGHAVFGQQISARSIRRLACDADIIPLVLGGEGQVLDVGRAQRIFPAHLRRALVARDKGCAFPDCSIPATWCEAHHVIPWSRGGTTNIDDGVLLCSYHHHVIHKGDWAVESRHGTPWFRPPGHIDPDRLPRRNRYWQVEEAVQARLLHDEESDVPRVVGLRPAGRTG